MKIGIVAGEPSGDFIGADLIRALRVLEPASQFHGICGPQMIEAGGQSWFPMEQISIMGFEGLAGSLRRILHIRQSLKSRLLELRPDVFVGIDVPDFNLGLELTLRRTGIPTIHYVSPTVWAWRRYRVHKIRRAVSHMLTLFPFEAEFYQRYRVPATFVGHPIASEIGRHLDQTMARGELDYAPEQRLIALLPGSRGSEISRLAPVFLQAAARLKQRHPDLAFVSPMVNQRMGDVFERIRREQCPDLELNRVMGRSRQVMAASDIVLAASGTAALEAALLEKPLVMAYKVSAGTAMFVKLFCHVKYYAMPNLLLEKPVVPEFVQGQASAENLAAAIEQYLQNPEETQAMKKQFAQIRKKLEGDAGANAAAIIARLAAAGVAGDEAGNGGDLG